MPRKNSDFNRGLEHLLNHSVTSPFGQNGPTAFKETIKASNLPLTEALKYIGKTKKKIPTKKDSEISEERIEKLEEQTEEKK